MPLQYDDDACSTPIPYYKNPHVANSWDESQRPAPARALNCPTPVSMQSIMVQSVLPVQPVQPFVQSMMYSSPLTGSITPQVMQPVEQQSAVQLFTNSGNRLVKLQSAVMSASTLKENEQGNEPAPWTTSKKGVPERLYTTEEFRSMLKVPYHTMQYHAMPYV